jgi:hypothetical protein
MRSGPPLVVNATNGAVSIEALEGAGEELLAGKVILTSRTAHPGVEASDRRLGDQLGGATDPSGPPGARVVKALNTMNNR